ncbi:MAG: hypothetical protein AMJ84_13030 [Acidithiobacillales bacterium SM23_46]|nr:MAG: hypothetical protein AMJ84_13030 [Acidithiobacillales bacterium SM23_46]
MATETGGRCHDHMVADLAVMTDVRGAHEKVAIAEHCRCVRFAGAVYGNALSKDIVVAYAQIRRHVLELQILRFATQDGGFICRIVVTHLCVALHDNVPGDAVVVAEAHIVLDDGEGADMVTAAKFGPRGDNSSGMNGIGQSEFPDPAG